MRNRNFLQTLFLGIIMGGVLVGCGFHSRSPSNIPPQLRTVYLDTPNPYSHLSMQVRRTLESLNVHLVKSQKKAPVTIHIISSTMTHDTPTIFYSGNAVSYTYSFSVKLELLSKDGKNITGSTTLNISRSLLQNANQVYTPEATAMMERQLTTIMTSLIYNYLTSANVRKALHNAFIKKINHRNHKPIKKKPTDETTRKTT